MPKNRDGGYKNYSLRPHYFRERFLALFTTVLVITALLLPGSVIEAGTQWVEGWLPWRPASPSIDLVLSDKVVHFLMFAVSAGLLFRAWPRTGPIISLMFLLALLTELAQVYVPGRSADWWDGLADLAGAGLGIAISCWIGKIHWRSNQSLENDRR